MPMLDGKLIAETLKIKPGKVLRYLKDEMIDFEILNPKATREDSLEYLKANGAKFLAKHMEAE